MAAETLSNSPLTQSPAHGLFGNLKVFHRKYEIAVTVEDGDIFELGYLPARSMVIGCVFKLDDTDTGTEVLDMDVGWAAAGEETDTYTDPATGVVYTNVAATADPDGFVNAGVLTGDGVTSAWTGEQRVQFYTDPLFFSAKTMVQIEANVPANVFAAGGAAVYLFYYML